MTKRDRQQLARAIKLIWEGPNTDRGWKILFSLRDGGPEMETQDEQEDPVRFALERAEEAFAEKLRVGRCMHDRADWGALLKNTEEALLSLEKIERTRESVMKKGYRVRYRLKGEDWQLLSAENVGEPVGEPIHYAYRSQADIGALWVALHYNWEHVHTIDGTNEICSYVKISYEGKPIIIGGKPSEDV